MRLLPVIDLKGGVVVHAVAGRRDEYRPLHSALCEGSSPAAVAAAYCRAGFADVYVADLDAIAGGEPAWQSYEAIAEAGLRMVLDAGVATLARVGQLADLTRRGGSVAAVVIGSEAVRDGNHLSAACDILGPDGAVFSLDLKHGQPIVANQDWSAADPLEMVAAAFLVGYRRLIVLDLAAVGVCRGPTTVDLCRDIRRSFSDLSELISGGGVRQEADVELLLQAGCDRVLVASALHAGTLAVR